MQGLLRLVKHGTHWTRHRIAGAKLLSSQRLRNSHHRIINQLVSNAERDEVQSRCLNFVPGKGDAPIRDAQAAILNIMRNIPIKPDAEIPPTELPPSIYAQLSIGKRYVSLASH